MKVIGAGLGRTGTDSLRHALARLLGGRCYHMKEVVARTDHHARWRAFIETREMDWGALLEDYVATVDWPGAAFYEPLMQAFPDAKVLLSVRDPRDWAESFQVLVHFVGLARRLRFVPSLGAFARLHDEILWRDLGDPRDRDACVRFFEAHVEAVTARVPAERLLVYRVQEGWEPLCRFLEVEVPDEPFPHVNSRAELTRFARRRMAAEVLRAPLDALREQAERRRGSASRGKE